MSIVDPTIDLNDTTPAAPANGILVKWGASGTDPRHVSAAVVGDGNTGHFLRGDGTFAAPATSGGYPVGANFTGPIYQFDQGGFGGGFAGYSAILRLEAGEIEAFGTGLTLNLLCSTGTVKVSKAVIYKTAPGNTTTIVATYQFLWSGVGNPTLANGQNVSDVLTVTTDTSHDWYIVVYWDATSTGNISSYNASTATGTRRFGQCGYLVGDYTATIPGALNSFMVGIAQVLLA